MNESSYEIRCKFGNKILPVKVTPRGDKLFLSFAYFPPMINEVKNMEGREWHPSLKMWSVANSRRNLFAFDILLDGSKIKVYDQPLKDYFAEVESLPFWMHQITIFNFIMTRRRGIVAAEMRTGKTRPTLKAIEQVEGIAWWIAPKSALRGLEIEMKRCRFTKKMYLMSYEKFSSYVQTIKGEGNANLLPLPNFVVFDECQKLKTPTSNRTKEAMYLSELMEDTYQGSEYMVGLSGTPAPRDPSDWWAICEVIRPGYLIESSKVALARRLGNWEKREGAVGNQYWHLVGWKDDEVHKLYLRLKGLVTVHLKKDCLDLPPKTYEIRELKPNSMILRVAKTIADQAENTLTAINKLRQLSDGFQYEKDYDPDKNKEVRTGINFVGSPKVDQLREDLTLHEDIGRIIIYAGFQGSVDLVTKVCLEEGWNVLQADGRGWQIYRVGIEKETKEETDVESEELVTWSVDNLLTKMDRSTDDGKPKKLAFVAQTDAAGTGLELSASSTIIYYSNSNSGDGRMQSEDRAHSSNMDKYRGLTIIDYIHLPTDKKIRDSLLEKKNLQSISLGELREMF